MLTVILKRGGSPRPVLALCLWLTILVRILGGIVATVITVCAQPVPLFTNQSWRASAASGWYRVDQLLMLPGHACELIHCVRESCVLRGQRVNRL
jgi:hypothetical protein